MFLVTIRGCIWLAPSEILVLNPVMKSSTNRCQSWKEHIVKKTQGAGVGSPYKNYKHGTLCPKTLLKHLTSIEIKHQYVFQLKQIIHSKTTACVMGGLADGLGVWAGAEVRRPQLSLLYLVQLSGLANKLFSLAIQLDNWVRLSPVSL